MRAQLPCKQSNVLYTVCVSYASSTERESMTCTRAPGLLLRSVR